MSWKSNRMIKSKKAKESVRNFSLYLPNGMRVRLEKQVDLETETQGHPIPMNYVIKKLLGQALDEVETNHDDNE